MKDTFITQYVFTHSGRFHLDEVFSYSLLTFLYSTKLIRTRDIEVLQEEVKNKNSILIDVGGSYNPSLQNFDHHMINDDLITTKKGPTCELSNIRQEIKKNIKDYLSKNGIYLSEIDSNKFIQKFRSLESKERELINIEQYKIAYLTKDIVKYLSFIQSEYQIIDPLSKIDSLIESPTLYFKEFYSLFEFRKYSSLGLVWKHYGREILREFLEQDIDDEGAERYEKELTKEIDDLWKVIDSDLIIKVDNLDNGIGYGSSLGNIIENYNTLDANDHTEQYEAFLEASEFLKGYFKRYLNKEIKELEDLNSIKSEYKEGAEIQYFSKYFRGFDPYILSIPNDKTRFIVFKKEEGKYVLKTLQIGDFQSRELLPASWLSEKPKGCTFIHTALFISEFNSLEAIKDLFKK